MAWMSESPDVELLKVSAAHSASAKPRARRLLILLLCIAVGFTLVYFSGVRHYLGDRQRVQQAVQSLGVWVYPVGILTVAALVSVGVPRLLFCAIGGAMLGFWWGLLITQVGTLIGYYASFCFIRWGGRDWVLHRFPRLQKWVGIIHEQGIMGVVLVRMLPLHGTLTNLCLGLTHVKHRDFLIGTIIGLLPEAVPAVLVGNVGRDLLNWKTNGGYLVAAVVGLALIAIGLKYAMRAMKHSQSGARLIAEATALNEVEE